MLLLASIGNASTDNQAVSSFDRNESFRGVAFGTPLVEASKKWDLKPLNEEDAQDFLKIYIRNDESKVFGSIRIQELTYYFLKGNFYAVEITTGDERQSLLLQQTLDGSFKHPASIARQGAAATWAGGKVSAFMNSNPATGEARTLIFSNDLQATYEGIIAESAKKASGQL
jgi:hypothetical protein